MKDLFVQKVIYYMVSKAPLNNHTERRMLLDPRIRLPFSTVHHVVLRVASVAGASVAHALGGGLAGALEKIFADDCYEIFQIAFDKEDQADNDKKKSRRPKALPAQDKTLCLRREIERGTELGLGYRSL